MVHGISPISGLVQRLIQNQGSSEDSGRAQEQSVSKYESLDKISISAQARQAASVDTHDTQQSDSIANLNSHLLADRGSSRLR